MLDMSVPIKNLPIHRMQLIRHDQIKSLRLASQAQLHLQFSTAT